MAYIEYPPYLDNTPTDEVGVTQHQYLQNLDYHNSGHTGFLGAKDTAVNSSLLGGLPSSAFLQSLTGAFLLDQTTPQTILNGVPIFSAGINTKITNNATNAVSYPLAIEAITTADMVDGFGAGINFDIQDDTSVLKNMGQITVTRYGSDLGALLRLRRTDISGNIVSCFSAYPDGRIALSATTVQGYLTLRQGDASYPPLVFSSGALLTTPIYGGIEFSTDRFYIRKDSLSIGTSSVVQSAPLEVNGGSNSTSGLYRLATNTGTNDVGFKMGGVAGAGTAGYVWIQGIHPGVANDGTLALNPFGGNVCIGLTLATAKLHLPAGTATASTAPLKFTSGTLNTAAEAGAIEFLTDKWYATITTGAARKELALIDAALTSGKIPIATTNGRLTDGVTPLAGTKVYYVSDSSGGTVNRKLTFTNGILTAET